MMSLSLLFCRTVIDNILFISCPTVYLKWHYEVCHSLVENLGGGGGGGGRAGNITYWFKERSKEIMNQLFDSILSCTALYCTLWDSLFEVYLKYHMGQHIRFQYSSHRQASKAQTSLHISHSLPWPSLLPYTKYGRWYSSVQKSNL